VNAPHNRDELLKRLTGRVVVVSVSGGKDSTAMALYLLKDLELPNLRFVYADTGWEHEETPRYIREVLTPLLGHIEWVGYEGGMPALVKKKGMFASRTRRFCTSELKVKPILGYLRQIEGLGTDVVSAVGIRSGESEARSKMVEWEEDDDFDCDIWRPLLHWTEEEVIAEHTKHGIRPNPLYLRGASRVGCWPCIFARKKEVQFIADETPEVIEALRVLEQEVGDLAVARAAAKGTTLEALGHNRPTFFQAPGALRSEGKDGRMVPIDEVVRWARTSRGGKQFELFAPETEQGCVRWGLCESMLKEDEP
jgi:3'-phosphoadenosine 5'-phosphosulfate sulfotransferase (PAPS reductase)/FAD synthetase